MIISLTEKCSEGCSHCFINSLPRSNTMNEETLDKTIDFLNRIDNNVILLSGGEVTEHPYFDTYISKIMDNVKKTNRQYIILSNGSWFFDEQRKQKFIELTSKYQFKLIQIRTHPKFYPNYKRTIEAKEQMEKLIPRLEFFDDGITLFPLGRARANHKNEIEMKIPACVNIFLAAKQMRNSTFSTVLKVLEERGTFCKPFISSKGLIHAGETPFCEVIGDVTMKDDEIISNILQNCKPKNKCGLYDNLPNNAKIILETKSN